MIEMKEDGQEVGCVSSHMIFTDCQQCVRMKVGLTILLDAWCVGLVPCMRLLSLELNVLSVPWDLVRPPRSIPSEPRCWSPDRPAVPSEATFARSEGGFDAVSCRGLSINLPCLTCEDCESASLAVASWLERALSEPFVVLWLERRLAFVTFVERDEEGAPFLLTPDRCRALLPPRLVVLVFNLVAGF